MSRRKTIAVGALNVVIHNNHHPQQYTELLKTIFSNKITAKIWSDYYGVLGWLNVKIDGKWGINGLIYRYVELNMELPILNISELTKIQDAPPILPDNLKYNVKEIYFYFDPLVHRLYYDASVISPKSAMSFFRALFLNQKIVDTFGPIDVHIEYSPEGIDRIINMPVITGLEVKVVRPNPDDLEDFEKEVFGDYDISNIHSSKEVYRPASSEGIKPKGKLLKKMKLAKSNGYVKAQGRDVKGLPIEESTEKHPLVYREKVPEAGMPTWLTIEKISPQVRELIQK